MNQEILTPQIFVEKHHGKELIDHFRYIENKKDTTVINWYKNQTSFANETLKHITNRHAIFNYLKQNNQEVSGEKITNLSIVGQFYFYLKTTDLNKAKSLYFKKNSDGKENLLFSPSESEKFKNHAINYIKPSPTGSKIIVSLTENDKEISQMIIVDTASKTIAPQIIQNCWPSALGGVSWLPDESGFFYMHIPVTDRNSEEFALNTSSVLYKLGTDPTDLNIILSSKKGSNFKIKEEDFPIVHLKDDKYIFAGIYNVSEFVDYYFAPITELNNKKINWKPLYRSTDKVKDFYLKNDSIYLLSAHNASNFKILKDQVSTIDIEKSRIVVPEDQSEVITSMAITKEGIFYVTNKNGISASIHKKDFESPLPQKINIPQSGDINLYSLGVNNNDLWIVTKGWISDNVRYKLDSENNTFVEENIVSSGKSNPSDLVVEEVEVKSHDGIMVPLSIIYKKGIKFNSKNRVMITGYGAYGFSDTPLMDDYIKAWTENNGIYAVAHVRGGGEKGDTWHLGGMKKTKPNTWKDFIACTKYLIDKKYTSSDKIVAWSASAGGVLIGRAITLRPDLYKAAIVRSGKLNATRSEFGPAGPNNITEFGTVKDSLEFNYLLEMDAYHHIKKDVKYPSMLLISGLNDPRTASYETGKFVAKLLAFNKERNPVLLKADTESGHGFDQTSNKRIEDLTDILSFALWQTGHPDFQPQ
ncbi:prolyl oligopeptidase family serine peptidase [Tenacibaculum sp. MEBiC06402]|uniref:prolyl oligopeptidase family serine peptidase n=1 Tax=unclassified Tenacibaculum TaxID=2635139 RepID=UPI003B9CEF47